MKSLIIYSSRSGNTKKLAQALNDRYGTKKSLISITDLPPMDGHYDWVAVGFPVMAGRVEPRAARFLSAFDCTTRKLFLFITHGSFRDAELVKNVVKQAVSLVKNAEVSAVFTCQGEVDPRVLYKLKKGSAPPAWLDEADHAVGHPDSGDIEELIEAFNNL
ncbi:MAG: flavodoxin family protein [Desulfobulbus propionicus]|nr:MAG: flavodoxin family protein [Desulfobulbus propionicus]